MKHYLRFLITLLIATVWCAGGYAQEKSITCTLATDVNKCTCEPQGAVSWNYGLNASTLDKTRGVQFLTNKNQTYTLTATLSKNLNISSIKINASKSGKNTVKKSIEVFVGDISFGTTSLTTTATDYTFSNNGTNVEANTLKINLISEATSASHYIKTVTIYYTDAPSSDKTTTTLSFPQQSFSFATTDDLTSFKGQTATLTAGDETLTGKTIIYEKTGDDIFSSFDENTGVLALNGKAGKATVKAAFAGDGTYASSNASYTISVKSVVKDIATLKPLITSTDSKKLQNFTLKLTDAIVTYVNKNTAYIQDATAGIYVYASGHGLENSQKINGLVDIGTCLFNGLPEIASWALASDAVVTENATFDIETVTLAELTANYSKYESKPVKVAGAVVTKAFDNNSGEISQDGTTYVVYNKGGSNVTITEGDNIDIVGYPAVFNKTYQLYLWKQSDVTVNYSQVATTLSLDPATTEYTVEKGKETAFTAPKVTVTDANNETVADAKVTYKSSNTDVANVAEDGTVSFVGFGTTTITASYAGDATHKAAKDISYTIIYGKVKTTMAWSATEATAKIGEDFTAPTLSLTADGESILDGKTITYESEDENVAMVDNNGTVVLMYKEGTTKITAKFAGDDTYADATASYTLTVVDPNKMEVTFDFKNNKYGYGTSSGSDKNGKVEVGETIVSGDVTIKNMVNPTNPTQFFNDELRIYKGAKLSIEVPTGYVMTAIDGNVSLTSCSWSVGSVTDEGDWTGKARYVEFELPSDANNNLKIQTLTVSYSSLPSVTFDENTETNSTVAYENAGETVNVTLNRTIGTDYLNPVCLPFAMDETQIAEAFGEGSKVSKLNENITDETLHFNYVNAMTAGEPYIVEATKASSTITLKGVTITENEGQSIAAIGDDVYVTFCGNIDPYAFTAADGTQLFLGKDNTLYEPQSVGQKLKGLRGYFTVEGNNSKALKIVVNGSTTTVDALMNNKVMTGKVYNLNGQYVGISLDGLAKGVYVMNGKKYVVK